VTVSNRVPVAPPVLDFGIRPRKAATVLLRSLYARRIRGTKSRSKANGVTAENRTMVIQ
jgi:hypothetical protein